ncbi:MAG: hypothetical protein WBG86_12180 [Polyangiales bacterium]
MRPGQVVLRVTPLLLAALVGFAVIDGEFVYDDPSALIESPIVTGEAPLWEAVTRDFWGRSAREGFTTWRPLMPMIWAQLWTWWPDDPLPFRILGVLLHVLAVGLGMRFVYRLRPSDGAAAAVGTLFALHPLNTEAVSAIVAQADVLSLCGVLVACTLALGAPRIGNGVASAAMLLLAALAKESAVVFTPLIALLFSLRGTAWKTRFVAAFPATLVGGAVIVFQLSLPRAPGIAMMTSNLAHHAEGAMRVWLGLYNIGRSLVMTVWPWPIAPNHGYAAVELYPSTLAPFAAIGAILLVIGIAAGVWAIRRRRLDWIAALSFLYAPALLQSHWFVRLITDLAERLLYPSVLGISMVVTFAILQVIPKPGLRAAAVATCALVSCAVSFEPRRAWTDEDALWSYAVRVGPRSAIHHRNVSNTLFRAGIVDQGAYHRLVYRYLIERFPDPVAWEVIEGSSEESPTERFTSLPATLSPGDPCPLVRAFAGRATEHAPLYAFVLQHWAPRYPQCGPWRDVP